MAAGFLLIIYLKSAPINGPIGLARGQFLGDDIVKFKNFPIKHGSGAIFRAARVAMFASPRQLPDLA